MTTARPTEEIPGPPPKPVVGNMFDIPADGTIQRLMELTREYGPIMRLKTPIGDRFICSGLDMIDALCDDTRFDKLVGQAQKELRKARPSNGLFTADTDNPMSSSVGRSRRCECPPSSAVSRPGPFGWPSASLDTACGRLGLAAIGERASPGQDAMRVGSGVPVWGSG